MYIYQFPIYYCVNILKFYHTINSIDCLSTPRFPHSTHLIKGCLHSSTWWTLVQRMQ